MPYVPWFRKWFNAKFGDLCGAHDFNYESRYPRKKADIEFAAAILLRGYPFTAFCAYVFVRLIGWFKYRRANRRVDFSTNE
jgi:hypothetical protein